MMKINWIEKLTTFIIITALSLSWFIPTLISRYFFTAFITAFPCPLSLTKWSTRMATTRPYCPFGPCLYHVYLCIKYFNSLRHGLEHSFSSNFIRLSFWLQVKPNVHPLLVAQILFLCRITMPHSGQDPQSLQARTSHSQSPIAPTIVMKFKKYKNSKSISLKVNQSKSIISFHSMTLLPVRCYYQ